MCSDMPASHLSLDVHTIKRLRSVRQNHQQHSTNLPFFSSLHRYPTITLSFFSQWAHTHHQVIPTSVPVPRLSPSFRPFTHPASPPELLTFTALALAPAPPKEYKTPPSRRLSLYLLPFPVLTRKLQQPYSRSYLRSQHTQPSTTHRNLHSIFSLSSSTSECHPPPSSSPPARQKS